MTLTVFVVPKLRTPNTWLEESLKISVLEDPSTSNMVNVHKHCWNLHHSTLIIFIDHCQKILVGKSLSWHAKLTCKILGLLVNTLAADGKYLVLHRDNLTTPIRIQLSEKLKAFCEFFAAFLKSRLNFKHF